MEGHLCLMVDLAAMESKGGSGTSSWSGLKSRGKSLGKNMYVISNFGRDFLVISVFLKKMLAISVVSH